MPLFGKKQEMMPALNKLQFVQHKEYFVQGPTSCLALSTVQGKEVVVASALNSRGFIVMGVDGDKLWAFDTGATVYSLAVGDFAGKKVILAGSDEKVFAVSEDGKELWRCQMPVSESKLMRMAESMRSGLEKISNIYGYNDVYHLVAGKLDGQDVAIAYAGGHHLGAGPQVISSDGKQVCALKRRTWGSDYPYAVAFGTSLDIAPDGKSVILWSTSSRNVFMVDPSGEIERQFSFKKEYARQDRYVEGGGGTQDKYRGKLVAGRLNGVDAFVVGYPSWRSVAAESLDGQQLWDYITNSRSDLNSGINDIAIGTFNGQSTVIIGTFDCSVHLIDAYGRGLLVWKFPSNVNNVAFGSIQGKEALAVGLNNGQILSYRLA